MGDKLLSVSEVVLYGQRVIDMKYIDPDTKPKPKPKYFVRILGFGFEGGYYDLDAPIIMLLEGDGEELAPTTPKDVRDAFPTNLRQWIVCKSDHSARLDELTGTVEDILLEVELGGSGNGGSVSGGRVSGGRVSGGRVSGGRVSGGRVSGGRVSGGKAD